MLKKLWCKLFHANRWGWPTASGHQQCTACLRVRKTVLCHEVQR